MNSTWSTLLLIAATLAALILALVSDDRPLDELVTSADAGAVPEDTEIIDPPQEPEGESDVAIHGSLGFRSTLYRDPASVDETRRQLSAGIGIAGRWLRADAALAQEWFLDDEEDERSSDDRGPLHVEVLTVRGTARVFDTPLDLADSFFMGFLANVGLTASLLHEPGVEASADISAVLAPFALRAGTELGFSDDGLSPQLDADLHARLLNSVHFGRLGNQAVDARADLTIGTQRSELRLQLEYRDVEEAAVSLGESSAGGDDFSFLRVAEEVRSTFNLAMATTETAPLGIDGMLTLSLDEFDVELLVSFASDPQGVYSISWGVGISIMPPADRQMRSGQGAAPTLEKPQCTSCGIPINP